MQSSANSHQLLGEGEEPPPSTLSPSIGHPTQLPASSHEPPLYKNVTWWWGNDKKFF